MELQLSLTLVLVLLGVESIGEVSFSLLHGEKMVGAHLLIPSANDALASNLRLRQNVKEDLSHL